MMYKIFKEEIVRCNVKAIPTFILISVGLIFWTVTSNAQVSDYPNKPIFIIDPTGGSNIEQDTRLYIQHIERNNPGFNLVFEQRAGAASTIGSAYVARAKPDGYTLLAPSNAFLIAPAVYSNLSYDVTRDFSAISLLTQKAYLLMVHHALPFRTVREYISYARQNPGELNFSTAGLGSSTHLPGALLHHMTKTTVTFVHYKRASDRVTDLVAGRVGATLGAYPTLLPYIKTGKLRALAVTTNKRLSSAPDIPTIAEAGVPNFEYSAWTGMLAPQKTPPEIISKIHRLWTDVLKEQALIKRFDADGTVIVASSPQEFKKFIDADSARWVKLLKETGIKIEQE